MNLGPKWANEVQDQINTQNRIHTLRINVTGMESRSGGTSDSLLHVCSFVSTSQRIQAKRCSSYGGYRMLEINKEKKERVFLVELISVLRAC